MRKGEGKKKDWGGKEQEQDHLTAGLEQDLNLVERLSRNVCMKRAGTDREKNKRENRHKRRGGKKLGRRVPQFPLSAETGRNRSSLGGKKWNLEKKKIQG